MRVLVTEGAFKHTLAAVRSLGRRGIDVAVTSHLKHSMSFFSRYCKRRILTAYPNTEDFIRTLLEALTRENYDVLLPIGIQSTKLISQFRDRLAPLVKIPIPDYAVMEFASDKNRIIRMAQSCGISIPQTFCPEDIKEVDQISKSIQYPAVIKSPDESYTERVRYVNSSEDLIAAYTEIAGETRSVSLPSIQEYIVGEGYGFFALFNRGNPRAVFMHHRLREYPITGGPSTIAESVYIPELKEPGLRLLKALNWHGVAMVEFKKDGKDGTFKLMELNPKFWGSLELAIASGVDFPYLACQMALNGDVEPVMQYRTGLKFRWLFPDDVLGLLANLGNGSKVRAFFSEFSNGNIRYDIRLDDPIPTFIQLVATGAQIVKRIKGRKLRYPQGKAVLRAHDT